MVFNLVPRAAVALRGLGRVHQSSALWTRCTRLQSVAQRWGPTRRPLSSQAPARAPLAASSGHGLGRILGVTVGVGTVGGSAALWYWGMRPSDLMVIVEGNSTLRAHGGPALREQEAQVENCVIRSSLGYRQGKRQ